jgi:hypothetical protein
VAVEVAKDVAGAGVGALEREAQRRRDEACYEVERLLAKVARLNRTRISRRFAPMLGLRIRIAEAQLGRAQDRCAAKRATGAAEQ